MTLLDLGYFCENFNSRLQAQLKFSSESIWIVLFLWTLLIVIIGPVRLMMIGGGHVFKWHHRAMYCAILSFIIDAAPFVLKMHSYLWRFCFKVRHVSSGVSGNIFERRTKTNRWRGEILACVYIRFFQKNYWDSQNEVLWLFCSFSYWL